MPTFTVYGGPHDGAKIRTSLVGPFIYTDGKRCYSKERKGHALHKLGFGTRRNPILMYVEHIYRPCSACGAYCSRSSSSCPLCGEVLGVRS